MDKKYTGMSFVFMEMKIQKVKNMTLKRLVAM